MSFKHIKSRTDSVSRLDLTRWKNLTVVASLDVLKPTATQAIALNIAERIRTTSHTFAKCQAV